jgi:3-hydroxyisobutyrate dehydrogenase-like beta-hydroxyacid dehydrogenase
MGAGMAANLLQAGHTLMVYDRTAERAAPLVERGAQAAASVADVCKSEVVFTMLANDEVVEQVVYGEHGVLANLAKDAIHISSSTISITLSARLAADHAAKRQGFVAAPVFGRPEAAAAGTLFVIAAGARAAVRAVMPLLDELGQRTFVVSETPKAANLVKLSGNFLTASVIESLGEAMALVAKGGVDRMQYLDILTSTLFDAPVYRTYGELVAHERFEPAQFAAALGEKDIRLALAAAETLRVPMPFASILRDRFLRLIANGGENLDWSAVGGLPARDAGLARV